MHGEAEPMEQIRAIVSALQALRPDSLSGVYLHGSAARGGLLSAMLRLSARYPAILGGARCLEVPCPRSWTDCAGTNATSC